MRADEYSAHCAAANYSGYYKRISRGRIQMFINLDPWGILNLYPVVNKYHATAVRAGAAYHLRKL